jgi:glycolate oxidase FAD binding subunit
MVSVDHDLEKYKVDGYIPSKTISPKSPESLADLLRIASENRWNVIPFGFGNMMNIGSIPNGYDIALDLNQMPKYIQHNSEDLTVTCSSNTSFGELNLKLQEKQQWLPFDSPLINDQSVGGLLACNLPGSLNACFGYIRDYVIGMKTATPFGQITKSGGTVVKNVTGFDLTRLHIGALGTLGIITEASFKIIPLPERQIYLRIDNENTNALIDLSSLLNNILQSFGVAELLIDSLGVANIYMTCIGTEKVVNEKLLEIKTILFDHEIDLTLNEIAEKEWLNIQDFGWINEDDFVLGRINCLPTDTIKILQQINRIVADNKKERIDTLTNSKRGVIKYKINPDNIEDTIQITENIRDKVKKHSGYTVIENSGTFDKNKLNIWGDIPESFPLMRKLKSEFDPVNILNSGRFIGGI